jgi:exopolysaccharide biosynthesis polyprenyl glycosylphosphotransferase
MLPVLMRRRFLLSVLASDLVALAIGMAAASLVKFETPLPWEARLPFGASIWPLIGLITGGVLIGSYLSARAGVLVVPRPSYGRAMAITSTAVASVAIGLVLFRVYWSRPFLFATMGVFLVGALAHRAIRRRRPWSDRMILITAEKGLVDDMRNSEHADIIAVFDPSGDPPADEPTPGVTLTLDLRPVLSEEMARFVSSWNLAGYPVRALGNVYEEHTGRLPIVHLAEGWELTAPVSRNSYAPVKRVLDVVFVVLATPIWLVLGALVWLIVRLDSKGPVLFHQERVGRGGGTFVLVKFRTMVQDAEAEGPRFTTVGDTRLTRVGRLLRKSRLDELPQLWNVLKGDLSLVGPRPEQPLFVDQFSRSIPFYRYRHLIRPGLTGWAQVNYGYADDQADTVDKLTYDLYYVKLMSPWLDLQILGKSVWTVLSGFGAQ